MVWDSKKISAMCCSCTRTTKMDVKECKGQNTTFEHGHNVAASLYVGVRMFPTVDLQLQCWKTMVKTEQSASLCCGFKISYSQMTKTNDHLLSTVFNTGTNII